MYVPAKKVYKQYALLVTPSLISECMSENYSSTFWMAGSLCASASTDLALEREGKNYQAYFTFHAIVLRCISENLNKLIKKSSLRNAVTEKVAGCRYQYTLVYNNGYMSYFMALEYCLSSSYIVSSRTSMSVVFRCSKITNTLIWFHVTRLATYVNRFVCLPYLIHCPQ